jgi:hypothetical protein
VWTVGYQGTNAGYAEQDLYRSTDAGRHWRGLALVTATQSGQQTRYICNLCSVYGTGNTLIPWQVDFSTPTTGFVLVQLAGGPLYFTGNMYVSRDGGKTWRESWIDPVAGRCVRHTAQR